MPAHQIMYRIYCFDAARHVVSCEEMEASSDEEAIAKAEANGFGTKCEIWEGRRLVAKLEADRRQA